ncbi:hypothetical protein [Methylopila sp. M107]|uniref:restriction endonuclease subunit S n=1 Tax=Methylopila sp. M107 TaxID=1101190 RepID=UPI0012DF6893|nr:hypothetical protein [Methylopila sp. M107]
MSDPLYEKAIELRSAIAAEIDDILEELRPLQERLQLLTVRRDSVIQMLSSWGGGIDVHPNITVDSDRKALREALTEAGDPHSAETKPSRPTDNATKEDVWRAARHLIDEIEKPYSRPDMYNYLTKELGMKIEGSNPLTVLSTMLWRTRHHSALRHFRSYGYWTADKPNEILGWTDADVDEWLEQLKQERLADGTAYAKDKGDVPPDDHKIELFR